MIKLPIAALVVIVGLLGGFYGGYKVGGGGRLPQPRRDASPQRLRSGGPAGRNRYHRESHGQQLHDP